jgi:hypothetical protein
VWWSNARLTLQQFWRCGHCWCCVRQIAEARHEQVGEAKSRCPSAATALRWGCVRSPGSSVRCGDLPLASPTDEPDTGRREGPARCSLYVAARQGRILTGAMRHLKLTLPYRHIHTPPLPPSCQHRLGGSVQQVYPPPTYSDFDLLRLGGG